jgi:hypothetical protein
MSHSQRFVEELQSSANQNVFIMMRYTDSPEFRAIETAIRTAVKRFGLIARLAKDRALSDDLWENIRIYMGTSRYGIAVFEEIDRRDFNPNVSLELGYMYALGCRCLLLKDKRMPGLPTDSCGKIYRNFDTYNANTSVSEQVSSWCEFDLGLTQMETWGHMPTAAPKSVSVIYDSASESALSSWGMFDSSRQFSQHVRLVSTTSSEQPGHVGTFELSVDGTEFVGVNKKVDVRFGTFIVEYCALSSGASALNLYLCAIPMKGSIGDLIEVGANRVSEAENGFSPYRTRHFIPHHHIGDGNWHTARIEFDFRQTPTAAYTICAARINEGCPRPGPGQMRIRNVRVTTFDS